jgi:rubredoxin
VAAMGKEAVELSIMCMRQSSALNQQRVVILKSWMCVICGFIYDEADGLPDEGIERGTKWDDVPPNWACPDCGARKEDFEMVEV